MDAAQVSLSRQVDTMEYYSAIKKKEILPLATAWVYLEGIMLSKISQRKKYHMISVIGGI